MMLISGCLFIGWYGREHTIVSAPQKQAPPLTVVFVQDVKAMKAADIFEYIGIVEPIKYVDLKPEVSGNIEKVLFNEGSIVKKGQVLFAIDDDKYKANVELKNAELDHAIANVEMLEKEYRRRLILFKDKNVSQASVEQIKAELSQARAVQKQAVASLNIAEIDLENTKIKSPINGAIGKALATEGHYVNAGSSNLAKIVQQSPIRIAFSVSDKDFLKGSVIGQENLDFGIELANGEMLDEKMTSYFVDNQIDKDTATIALFSEFKNNKNLLLAGNYVKVKISEKNAKSVIAVPATAIGEDKFGSFVYVLSDDQTAKQVRVKTGNIIGTKQIIKTGLNVGEKIIIEGLQKIKNNQKVKAQIIKDI